MTNYQKLAVKLIQALRIEFPYKFRSQIAGLPL